MNIWSWLWVGWLVYFGVVETVAIVASTRAKAAGRHAERKTLSEHTWWWFGTAKGTEPDTSAYLRRFVLVAFLAWLSIHFLGGGQFV